MVSDDWTSREILKRISDVVLATIGLLLLCPLLCVLAIWIKFDSPGPVLYRGRRAGRFGKPFWMFKLRTMVCGSDKNGRSGVPANGQVGTASDDPRITRVGRFLRRSKLDEIPQFINVLKGDMSVVGPRPEVVEEIENYSEEELPLLSVRPGMTDSASVRYWHEAELLLGCKDQEQVYYRDIRPEKVRLRLEYVRNPSLRTDARILFQTVWHFGRVLWSRRRRSTATPERSAIYEISHSDPVFRTRTGSSGCSSGCCGSATRSRRS